VNDQFHKFGVNYFYILNDFALDITINKRFTMKEME
jgi:hypothetical protein